MPIRRLFLAFLSVGFAAGCTSGSLVLGDEGAAGDDDAADDDMGDDDTGPENPLIGTIWVQAGYGVGQASYAFDAEDDVYIDYADAPPSWRMDNWEPMPEHKPFVDLVYEIPQRTFRATIDWFEPEETTVGGARTWEYEMVFSADWEVIEEGTVVAFAPGGANVGTWSFGTDLVYTRYH